MKQCEATLSNQNFTSSTTWEGFNLVQTSRVLAEVHLDKIGDKWLVYLEQVKEATTSENCQSSLRVASLPQKDIMWVLLRHMIAPTKNLSLDSQGHAIIYRSNISKATAFRLSNNFHISKQIKRFWKTYSVVDKSVFLFRFFSFSSLLLFHFLQLFLYHKYLSRN